MDFKRISSALLGFPLVLIILIFGNKYVVDVAMSIIAIMSLHEYFNAVSKESKPVTWVGYLACASICFIHVIPSEYLAIAAVLLISIILLMLFLKVIISNMKTNFKDIAYTFFGILYIGFSMMFLAGVNGMQDGKFLIWYLLFAAWGTDVFAYFVGIAIGKHKFSKVSPKKSIEGCIGGTLGAIVLMLIFTWVINTFFGMSYSYPIIAAIGLVLSLIGQVGDFAASAIKRYVDIKDYSNLIPGHGGMLDRIDSLIFIAPFAFAFFSIM